jgi:hypothetical protein
VIEIEKFVPTMCDPIESKTVDCFRWWSVREFSVTRERLTPLSLAEIVTRYIRDGSPHEPMDGSSRGLRGPFAKTGYALRVAADEGPLR